MTHLYSSLEARLNNRARTLNIDPLKQLAVIAGRSWRGAVEDKWSVLQSLQESLKQYMADGTGVINASLWGIKKSMGDFFNQGFEQLLCLSSFLHCFILGGWMSEPLLVKLSNLFPQLNFLIYHLNCEEGKRRIFYVYCGIHYQSDQKKYFHLCKCPVQALRHVFVYLHLISKCTNSMRLSDLIDIL